MAFAPRSADSPAPARARGRAGEAVGVEPEDGKAAVAVERGAEVVLHAFGAGAVAGNRDRAAFLAASRHRLAVAAVMAGERGTGRGSPRRSRTGRRPVSERRRRRHPATVQHERDVAVRAAPHLSAGVAGEEVRPAAAVEQHDRLAARGAHLGERLRGQRVQAGAVLAHVEHRHVRQRAAVHARGQAQALGIAGRVHALGARGGASEQQQRAARAGALGGHVAGVVAGIALVLVGGVVLLVDHDQAEALDRREHRRPRADAHARLAAAQAPPFLVALAGTQPRVQHGHRLAKALVEAADDLRRERDLGHEHDRAAILCQRGRGGAQVDLGLARSGHPVQQPASEAALEQRAAQRLQHAFLRVRELRRPRTAATDREMAHARGRAALAAAEAPRGAGREHERQRTRERRAVLGGDPARKLDELAGNARLERAQRREQLLGGNLAIAGEADDDAQHLPARERHDQRRADVDVAAQLGGQVVVERPAQRAGGGHRLDLGDRRHGRGP